MGLLPCFILLLKTLEELGQLGFGFVTQGLLLCDKLLQVASINGKGDKGYKGWREIDQKLWRQVANWHLHELLKLLFLVLFPITKL